jgi:hypothetical protein
MSGLGPRQTDEHPDVVLAVFGRVRRTLMQFATLPLSDVAAGRIRNLVSG